MSTARDRELFIKYMNDTNYLGDIKPRKKPISIKVGKYLPYIILTSLALITLWHIVIEVMYKLRLWK